MVGGSRDRGLYDGRNVSGASMWLEVGAPYICICARARVRACVRACVRVCVNKLRQQHDGITARSK